MPARPEGVSRIARWHKNSVGRSALFATSCCEQHCVRSVIAAVLALFPFFTPPAFSRPVAAYEAQLAVSGWLFADSKPLDTILGRRVSGMETVTGNDGSPVYYIVQLDPLGIVIAPADDLVEPIVVFCNGLTPGTFSRSPLAALVAQDLGDRLKSARAAAQDHMQLLSVSDTQSKWRHLIDLAQTGPDTLTFMGINSVSDVRVPPLIRSKWSQDDVCGKSCYNYYTPNHYLSGCVATAAAQLMRYFEHPATGIGQPSFTIQIEGSPRTAALRGGDGFGGPYSWPDMIPVPGCSMTETQRRAIGALCYDAGVSLGTGYSPTGSSADLLDVKTALTKTFKYANAIRGANESREIGSGLPEMINPNLDAECPVLIGLVAESGHAALCDGYGYNASTLYHHLNMGWSGMDDIWYNLPDVLDYNSVRACVYNVFIDRTGEIISGRIIDSKGNPVEDATVTAQGTGGLRTVVSNARGVYALVGLSSSANYTVAVTKARLIFKTQTVRTGISRDWSAKSGNRWKIDFSGTLAGDLNADNVIDLADFATLASAWFSKSGDPAYKPECDISQPKDNVVDLLDLAAIAEMWLQ